MDNTDLILLIFQYLMGVIPGDIAGNIVAVVTTLVTICTLIIRFWKQPNQSSKFYKLWKIVHVLASFKTPSITKVENTDGHKNS